MNPHPLSIISATTRSEYGCQRIYVTGSFPLGGQLECEAIVHLPPANDRIFKVLPLGFIIEIKDDKFESKKPSFIVLS
jgi:hypothetical protein